MKSQFHKGKDVTMTNKKVKRGYRTQGTGSVTYVEHFDKWVGRVVVGTTPKGWCSCKYFYCNTKKEAEFRVREFILDSARASGRTTERKKKGGKAA